MSEFLTPMDSETFLKNYPEKPIDAYKGMHGRTLLIGGSYGMAGAVCLNILGAQAADGEELEDGVLDGLRVAPVRRGLDAELG